MKILLRFANPRCRRDDYSGGSRQGGDASGTGMWGSLAWTYDGVGNRLTENTNSYTYEPNTNKLISASGISYGYDNDGNKLHKIREYTQTIKTNA